jgi:hypothetical protein
LQFAAVLALAITHTVVDAQDKPFNGVFLGVEASNEDLIGGAFVDGVDFLAQNTRGVVSVAAGVRVQARFGGVAGIEGTLGFTDGDLTASDAVQNLRVDYTNDTQTSIGGLLGFAFHSSRPLLLFAYASEVTRHFDVTVMQGTSSFNQKDEQGMLRYGLGAEAEALDGLHLRLRVGKGRADFGKALTNITPATPIQYAVGIVYQF